MAQAEELLTPEEIKEKKPNLSDAQLQLAHAYAEARSWKKSDDLLAKEEILESIQTIIYPPDLALEILKSLDDFRMGLIVERMKNRNQQ